MVPSDNYDIIVRTDGAACIVGSHIHIQFSDTFVPFDINNIQQCTLNGFIKSYKSFFTDMFTMCQGRGHLKKKHLHSQSICIRICSYLQNLKMRERPSCNDKWEWNSQVLSSLTNVIVGKISKV